MQKPRTLFDFQQVICYEYKSLIPFSQPSCCMEFPIGNIEMYRIHGTMWYQQPAMLVDQKLPSRKNVRIPNLAWMQSWQTAEWVHRTKFFQANWPLKRLWFVKTWGVKGVIDHLIFIDTLLKSFKHMWHMWMIRRMCILWFSFWGFPTSKDE